MMLEVFIIPLMIYIAIDGVKFYRRNKYILRAKELVYVHKRERAKVKWYEILTVIITTMVVITVSADISKLWLVALVIVQIARDKFKLNQELVLYKDGMLFDMTYILWNDMYKVRRTNNNSLIIESYNFALGEFKIENLDNIDELEMKMKELINASKT